MIDLICENFWKKLTNLETINFVFKSRILRGIQKCNNIYCVFRLKHQS